MYVQQNLLLMFEWSLHPPLFMARFFSRLKDVTPIIRYIWLVKMWVIAIL